LQLVGSASSAVQQVHKALVRTDFFHAQRFQATIQGLLPQTHIVDVPIDYTDRPPVQLETPPSIILALQTAILHLGLQNIRPRREKSKNLRTSSVAGS